MSSAGAFKPSWVYFLGIGLPDEAEPLVKIGWTGRHRNDQPINETLVDRFREQAASWAKTQRPVEFIAAVLGTKEDEQHVHGVFSRMGLRVDGFGETELFRPANDIIDYLRWLRDQSFVAVDLDLAAQCERRPYDEWDPRPDHFKRREVQRLLFGGRGTWLEILGEPEPGGDDFYTYDKVIEAARYVMGGIDVDPASHPVANRVVKAKQYYTVADNGLLQPWRGNVWLNPPFSNWDEFIPKATSELDSGRIVQLCIYAGLNSMNAKQFGVLKSRCSRLCLGHGRWPHWGKKSEFAPTFSSGVLYFGNRTARFDDVFSKLGHVYALVSDYSGPDSAIGQIQLEQVTT